ncbi:MAG: hypothetical protein M3R18_05235, partial [Pseudomonadota bacterium]|nr:hypothetical protein [Pseudomonadota bacterium]
MTSFTSPRRKAAFEFPNSVADRQRLERKGEPGRWFQLHARSKPVKRGAAGRSTISGVVERGGKRVRMGIGARFVRGLGLAAWLLGGIFFGCAVAGVTTAGNAVAQTASNIVVEGNRRVEADTIRSYFRAGPGGRLDAAQIDQGLKGLYATGLFQDVRINQAGGRLVVTVVENPVINRVAFEGNKKVK